MFIEVLGFVIGLIYLWLEYEASIYLWIAGIIMPAISLFVYYQAGLYADFGINVYYLLAALYGWLMWKPRKSVSLPITRIPRSHLWGAAAAFAFAWLFIAWILIRFTNSNVPWFDAFTTALSIVGMWMLARKYVEQWLAWILVDAVSAGLYVYKEIYFYAILYALYTVIAYLGYKKWLRLM